MITSTQLRILRNQLPLSYTFKRLGHKAPYAKKVQGRLRFVCPYCNELLVAVNKRNNLAHCFCCHSNINNIDLLMALGYEFKETVCQLQHWLKDYLQEKPQKERSDQHDPNGRPKQLATILLEAFEQDAK